MEKEKGNNNGNTILLTVIGVATLLVALVGATFAYFSASISNEQAESINMRTAQVAGLVYTGKEFTMENIVPGDSKNDETGKFTVENPRTVGTESTPNKVQQTYDLTLYIDTNELSTAWVANDNSTKPADADTKLADQLRLYVTQEITRAGKNAAGTAVTTTQKTLWAGTDVAAVKKEDATKGVYLNLTDGTSAAAAGKTFKLVDDQQIAIDELHTYQIEVEFVNYEDVAQDANQNKSFAAHIEIGDTKSVQNS